MRGRDVGDGDRLDAPFVAVVNEQLVKDAFPGVDPIGRTIRAGLDSLTPMTIVGIVKDIRTRGPARPVQAEIYFPYEQHPGPATALNLVVRADTAEPLAAGAAVARLIRTRHAEMPVRLEAMTTTLAAATATPRFRTALLVAFAGVALLLALAGVYGVMAYTVSQRVPEIGLRVALGATPRDVLGLVLKDGGVLVAAGLALGTALTIGGSRLLAGLALQRLGPRPAGADRRGGAGCRGRARRLPGARTARAAGRPAPGLARRIVPAGRPRFQPFRRLARLCALSI